MATLYTLKQLKTLCYNYVAEEYIANREYTPTKNDYTGLINKIVQQVTFDGDYAEDLAFMDGDTIPVGDTIEEYFQGFVAPVALDPKGENTLSPSDPIFMPATYSTALGEQTFKTTERYSQLQKSFLTEAGYQSAVSFTMKRIYDSLTLYLNEIKRTFLGKIAAKLTSVADDADFDASKAYAIGDRIKNGVVLKKITENQYDDLAAAIADHAVVELDLAESIAVPTTTETGEAWIISVKNRVEKFQKPRQGCSYNGNIAGKGTYILLVKEGVFPNLEVNTLAGAFHLDQLGFGNVQVKSVKDFGSNTSVFAMLIDERAAKVHNNARYVLDQINADGGFLNHVIHDDETCHYSVNTMAYVWNAQ